MRNLEGSVEGTEFREHNWLERLQTITDNHAPDTTRYSRPICDDMMFYRNSK